MGFPAGPQQEWYKPEADPRFPARKEIEPRMGGMLQAPSFHPPMQTIAKFVIAYFHGILCKHISFWFNSKSDCTTLNRLCDLRKVVPTC